MSASRINDVVEFDFTGGSLRFGLPFRRNGAIWVLLREDQGGDLVFIEDACALGARMAEENVIVFRSVLGRDLNRVDW